MRFLPVNTNALLVELDDLDQTLALLASLTEQPIAGVEGLVPAARTLLVSYRPSAQSFATLVEAIAGRAAGLELLGLLGLVRCPIATIRLTVSGAVTP